MSAEIYLVDGPERADHMVKTLGESVWLLLISFRHCYLSQ